MAVRVQEPGLHGIDATPHRPDLRGVVPAGRAEPLQKTGDEEVVVGRILQMHALVGELRADQPIHPIGSVVDRAGAGPKPRNDVADRHQAVELEIGVVAAREEIRLQQLACVQVGKLHQDGLLARRELDRAAQRLIQQPGDLCGANADRHVVPAVLVGLLLLHVEDEPVLDEAQRVGDIAPLAGRFIRPQQRIQHPPGIQVELPVAVIERIDAPVQRQSERPRREVRPRLEAIRPLGGGDRDRIAVVPDDQMVERQRRRRRPLLHQRAPRRSVAWLAGGRRTEPPTQVRPVLAGEPARQSEARDQGQEPKEREPRQGTTPQAGTQGRRRTSVMAGWSGPHRHREPPKAARRSSFWMASLPLVARHDGCGCLTLL